MSDPTERTEPVERTPTERTEPVERTPTERVETERVETERAETDLQGGPPEIPWRRLSARMLLIHPLRSLKELLPAVLPALIVGNTRSDGGNHWWNLGIGALVLLIAVITWATTRYRIADGRVQQRKGLLKRETLTVPIDRVRSVDLQASPLHRILGLSTARIGTGVAGGKPLVLDGLTSAEAATLRAELLVHRGSIQETEAAAAGAALEGGSAAGPSAGSTADGTTTHVTDGEPGGVPSAPGALSGTQGVPVAPEPEVLSRFDARWVRYAPLSTSGLLIALAIIGFAGQLSGQVLSDEIVAQVTSASVRYGVVALVAAAAAVAVVFVLVCAVVAYVLAYWGHTVTREGDRLHITRGLLTVRSTTLDLGRLRGVAMGESLLIRAARGASLKAVTTGIGGEGADQGVGSSSGSGLLPPAPRRDVHELAARLLGEDRLGVPLRSHGRAARRRRWSRALQAGVALLLPPLVPVLWLGWSWWWVAPFAIPLLLAPVLAEDRWRNLGHAVLGRPGEPRQLVTRMGSLHRRTVALDADGIIGWTVRETFWQRRVGVATLVAATAAGSQHYDVVDVPTDRAWEIVSEELPLGLGQTRRG
ncbi:PH domain-containing protein [Arsenicicoccus bolidensis]|uniref:PH domain-containing protein n=1 Tax=Arsenicicoccus bolidensis TaxID=229480 RepID=A0ABS9Q2R4_9MICO|nr:PH domain-containing protein [Arsenicicoccus bolidensis]MCG7321597.1 PH domain-containing protein [Arsenicicoccus bolidensis]